MLNDYHQEAVMTWNIASAKQQFSEVVRLTAEEPQAIYNRDKPVAVMISAQDFADFARWRAERDRPKLAQHFDEIRALLAADGQDGIEIPLRTTRYNAMVDAPHYWDEPTDSARKD
ncbi:MAG: type II toxin-antitoxin system Phd/YefM family antitoxin [Simplicispira suum]|uniref:type II toxin-antitoxin system Phd/YefM family antitoxin n=1 Tax=Simplicispira suum TaxID=2109915 RepID=UPI001C6C4E5A|nr:type II toxin-antitoxin system Phd/YefM family antitoxin [Simplicispira suum]MBW7831734.1 type II toxin-antitoxin system Phd/YefM family antitoxin [Simplicispira suum]